MPYSASLLAVFRAQLVPWGQNCSLPPCVDHQLDVIAHGRARGPHQELIERGVATAKRPPAQLDRL